MPGVGEGGVGGLRKELHGARTEPPKGFEGQQAESVARAVVVCVVLPAFVDVPASCGVAGVAGGLTDIRSGQGVNKRDIGKDVARAGVQDAVEVRACLGAMWGARSQAGVATVTAGGESQATHKVPQHDCSGVMSALHEGAELIAAEGVSDVNYLYSVTARAQVQVVPKVERDRTPMRTRAASWNDGSSKRGGGRRGRHRVTIVGPGRDTVEECLAALSGPKAGQSCLVGGVNGAADECGQLVELGSERGGVTDIGRGQMSGKRRLSWCQHSEAALWGLVKGLRCGVAVDRLAAALAAEER